MNAQLPPLQPLVAQFLDAQAREGGTRASVEAARAAAIAAQSSPPFTPDADVEERSICGVPAFIYRPAGARGLLPAAVYLHGGGFVAGGRRTHDRLVRELTAKSGVAMVLVEYSLSPEALYPTALAEAIAVATHLSTEGAAFGIDGSRLAVAGDGAGANLAAVVALVAGKRGYPRLRFQALFCPVTDAAMETRSYREFAEGYLLTAAHMQKAWDAYVPLLSQRGEASVSPLRAPQDQLRRVPPALVITADHDVLRDEGEYYAGRLLAAGVPVVTARYSGTIHGFMVLDAFTEDPSPRAAIAQAAAALKAALSRPLTEGTRAAH